MGAPRNLKLAWKLHAVSAAMWLVAGGLFLVKWSQGHRSLAPCLATLCAASLFAFIAVRARHAAGSA